MEEGLFLQWGEPASLSETLSSQFAEPVAKLFLTHAKTALETAAHAFTFPVTLLLPQPASPTLLLFDWEKRHRRATTTPRPFPAHFGLANLSTSAVLAGGLDGAGTPLADVLRLTAACRSDGLAPMFTKRSHFPLAIRPEERGVFAVGGLSAGGAALQEAERYSFSKDAWSPLGSLRQARYLHAASCYGPDDLFALCGQQAEGTALASVERLRLD